MRYLRSVIIALVILSSLASTILAQDKTWDCTAEPEACEQEIQRLNQEAEENEAMLAQYEQLYGPLPSPQPTPDPVSINIEMTGGQEPPAEVAAKIKVYEGELREIALFFCTDKLWVDSMLAAAINSTMKPEEAVLRYSGFEALGWQPIYDEYFTYLQEQAAAGYNVPNRPPTLWELIQQYPGCETGEYEAPN